VNKSEDKRHSPAAVDIAREEVFRCNEHDRSGDRGFDDEACGFFDFFATPVPGADKQTVAVVQSGIDSGECSGEARVYARLFQTYELMFWSTIAEEAE